MSKYARELPQDKQNNVYPSPPAYTSYQSQKGVPLASSVLTLTDKTTVLEVMAIGGQAGNAAILGKWGVASVTTANYDFMVPVGGVYPFVVPVSVMAAASIAGANVMNGLYPAVSFITATATSASVFTVEY